MGAWGFLFEPRTASRPMLWNSSFGHHSFKGTHAETPESTGPTLWDPGITKGWGTRLSRVSVGSAGFTNRIEHVT